MFCLTNSFSMTCATPETFSFNSADANLFMVKGGERELYKL